MARTGSGRITIEGLNFLWAARMLQNDLIMRMIETIAIAMKQILAAGDSGDMKTVASELDEASRLLVGVEFWVLSTMSVNDVLGRVCGSVARTTEMATEPWSSVSLQRP